MARRSFSAGGAKQTKPAKWLRTKSVSDTVELLRAALSTLEPHKHRGVTLFSFFHSCNCSVPPAHRPRLLFNLTRFVHLPSLLPPFLRPARSSPGRVVVSVDCVCVRTRFNFTGVAFTIACASCMLTGPLFTIIRLFFDMIQP